MFDTHINEIAAQLSLSESQVRATVLLLDDGATLPFIARYRKEATEGLDEVAVAGIRDLMIRLRLLDERRRAILTSLEKRGLLTDQLRKRLSSAESLSVLEDIYLPFRPKRKTRAGTARERGLEPLARRIFAQKRGNLDPIKEAKAFVSQEKGVASTEEALAGARDIMAEWMSEDEGARFRMRALFSTQGLLRSSKKQAKKAEKKSDIEIEGKREKKSGAKSEKEIEREMERDMENEKYLDYLDYSEPVSHVSAHRFLAMQRGECSGILRLHLAPSEDEGLAILEELFIKDDGPAGQEVRLAMVDGYRRLLAPSMEAETISSLRSFAEEKAIEIFSRNLREVLLEPPLGRRRVLAVDPGYRTGCKLAVLDGLGRLLEKGVIFPHGSPQKRDDAAQIVRRICKKKQIEFIAVGNGTAGRETEAFLRGLGLSVQIVMVNESGASVYSTSDIARQEFPDEDATVRGAVSIGRRLMDPLAELVKIEPKSIGVGQYQHDVDQSNLRRALDDVVLSCVNLVGVDLNTASKELLSRVAGLGPGLAQAIVRYREEHGIFGSRKELLKVPRLGPKAFEQAAGFLRIREGSEPLDSTAVHPESYSIVRRMAKDLSVGVAELLKNESLLRRLDPGRYISESAGAATVSDIIEELSSPGRDPRSEFEPFSFAENIERIEELKPGMMLPGIVTNVTAFGAFVDVGVHQDGLLHISQMRDSFVQDPNELFRARQRVMVRVIEVDLARRRISLSMKKPT